MSAGNRCFNNSLIVQGILKNITVLENIQLRLITKTCDQEVLRELRLRLGTVRINVEIENLPKIRVNGCLVKPRDFFQFLISTAGVKVEGLEVVRDGKLESWEMAREIHDHILDVLLKDATLTVFKGMSALCEGACQRCGKYAMQSKEFGSVSLWGVRNFFGSPKHFDKLIVDDQLLWRIAGLCQFTFDNRAGQMAKMKSYIHSRISCDHLQIRLYDDPKPTENDQNNLMNGSLPREILEEMCTTWRVKSLGISFQSQDRGEERKHLTEERVFTELQWTSPHPRETRISTGFLLDYVEVDLENAPKLFNSIFGDDENSNYYWIGNIRRVFPAKQFYFNGHRMSGESCPKMMTHIRVNNMIQTAMYGATRSNNAPVTIRQFVEVADRYFCLTEKFEWEWDFGIEGYFTGTPSGSIKAFYDGVERIGKQFIYREKETGCEINLEIYVEKAKLMDMIARHRVVRMGFLKHFVFNTHSIKQLLPRSLGRKTRQNVLSEFPTLRNIQNPMSSTPLESMGQLNIQNPLSMGLVRCKDSMTRFVTKLVVPGMNAAITVYGMFVFGNVTVNFVN